MSDNVPISVFKAQCLALLKRVQETGQPLLVTRFGKPVAQVLPPPAPAVAGTWLGSMAGTLDITGDLIEPLDVPWEALEP
jgi:prevent-host-death family protein